MAEREEPRYTLSEARRVLAQRECDRLGHSFEIPVNGEGVPLWIDCSRCGRSWGTIKRAKVDA